ncbi:MAG TPA: DUF2905 domain-containing protein [Gammaproteobacteria bacterium]|nr:DUF2905 domain-containing protein [Gammaproteobacteria bacterium]
MARVLIIAGLALVAIGLAWPWLARLPLGRLPGDLHYQRDGVSIFLPLGTGLVLSVLLSLLLWVFRR